MSEKPAMSPEEKAFREVLESFELLLVVKGILVGLMLGVVECHAIQPIAAWAGVLPWGPKMWVAIGGAVLYLVCTVGLYYGKKWAPWVAIVGPLVGFSVVLGGQMLDTPVRPDVWTWGGAALQVPGIVLAAWLVLLERHTERQKKELQTGASGA